MNRNSEARFKKKYSHRRNKPIVVHGDLPSARPLAARIIDDGTVYTATILNGRGLRDFVRLFSDDLDELRLRLRQNGIASQA